MPGFEQAKAFVHSTIPKFECFPEEDHKEPEPIDLESILLSPPSVRYELSRIFHEATFSSLIARTEAPGYKRLKGILLTGLQPHSRRAACLMPNKFYRTILGNDSFKMIVKYGLGAEVWKRPSTLTSVDPPTNLLCPFCKSPMDPYGDHASFCARAALRITKHNDLRNMHGAQCSTAGASVTREIRGLVDKHDDRPADNLLTTFSGVLPDSSIWVDYAIPSPFAAHCYEESCSIYGAATNKCAQVKCDNASEAASLSGAKFLPFVIASTGGFHDSALELVDLVAKSHSSRWNLDVDRVRLRMIDQISICVQRGNARMWQEAGCTRSRARAYRGFA